MAEEHLEEREWVDSKNQQRKNRRKHRKSEVVSRVQHSDVRRLSLPATLTVSSLEESVVQKCLCRAFYAYLLSVNL